MVDEVSVLRLGHRPQRDKRLTTHLGLTARAFGADRLILTREDAKVAASIEDVAKRFGGGFDVEVREDWRAVIRGFDGPTLHLTMYGEQHTDVLDGLEAPERVLLVVGAEKVPGDVYELVTHNVAVGNQPHSEVAALATMLYGFRGPEALYADREGAELVIEPSAQGKRVRSGEEP